MPNIQVGDAVLTINGLAYVAYIANPEILTEDCDVLGSDEFVVLEDGEGVEIDEFYVDLAVGNVDYATLDSLVEWME